MRKSEPRFLSCPTRAFSWWFCLIGFPVAVVAGLALISCSNPSSHDARPEQADRVHPAPVRSGSLEGGFPRSIKTIDGEVVVPSPPQRIVSQTLATDEILLEICPRDRLVGIHTVSLDPTFSNVVEVAETIRDRAVNGTEAVISLEPDLVFVASFSRAEFVDQLRQGCQAPIVRFSNFNSIEDIRNNIRMTGYLIGEETAARELVGEMDRRILTARKRIPQSAPPPRVVSFGPASYTAGSGTLFDDVLRCVGAVNLSAENGVEQFGQIGTEQVAYWNPDWVVCGIDPGSEEPTRKWFYENPVLSRTRAGKRGRLLLVPNRLYTSTSHHLASLVEHLSRNFYPTPSEASAD